MNRKYNSEKEIQDRIDAAYEQGITDGREQVLKEEMLRQEIMAKNDSDFLRMKKFLISYETHTHKPIIEG